MENKTARLIGATMVFILNTAAISSSSIAATTLTAAVGGTPVGTGPYVNFDSLAATGGTVDGGITVSFRGIGAGAIALPQVVGKYASPYIMGGNGALFGNNQADGLGVSQYLSTGIGEVTLQLDQYHNYFGLLWGSVDDYNRLSFYDGANLLFSYTGLDVDPLANGNQGAAGTFYVNITSDTAFNRVVALSTKYGFEIDNVALNTNLAIPAEVSVVPEPHTYIMLLAGLLLVGRIAARSNTSSR
ncbi:putative secreted protein with PEP-CTERM sorting signal [Nitrosospira sp. Nsp2]|uniref:Npun_F0296 family exosortase-dependent surface protein n=1 Tax=Nitrosospira sp. Nsp2 TaxID=136548 RepID=UPI000D31F463|nr:PEP-CTERM sorting domain-containing protein [Nitrosospira sp. Nsp2]PTR17650.1 putative secreted protein with PEP-CTERM sorting signal [Nitrosospira sp. Nsp2]